MSTTNTQYSQIRLDVAKKIYYNLPFAELIEHAIRNKEAVLSSTGALVAYTGKYTGRTPKDKYVVREPGTENVIWWKNNQPMEEEVFQHLKAKAQKALAEKQLYITDTYASADPAYRLNVRFVCEKAWHALFVKQLLLRPQPEELEHYEPEWTIVNLAEEKCSPAEDHTRSEAVIAIHFGEKMVLIMGTHYAGEMKKSVFTIMNAILPLKGVLSMHCSANIGQDSDTALFFGLSGTGKTTLSADPLRRLIGDDEHGWTDTGIFNIEGGCYAKCIRLTQEGEPQIWNAIRFGSVLENVVLDQDRVPQYDDASITENTRCAYPVDYIEGAALPSLGANPNHIFFLTCDAFGVLPPIAKLNSDQAMEYFLMGYTAKVAGTETGVTEPVAVFSACFGQPFLPLSPNVYANLLKQKIVQHNPQVWLVNTGWTGGPYGKGERIPLKYTREILHAALGGKLDQVAFSEDPVFGLSIPKECPGVPSQILFPRSTWENPSEYDAKAEQLKKMFEKHIQH